MLTTANGTQRGQLISILRCIGGFAAVIFSVSPSFFNCWDASGKSTFPSAPGFWQGTIGPGEPGFLLWFLPLLTSFEGTHPPQHSESESFLLFQISLRNHGFRQIQPPCVPFSFPCSWPGCSTFGWGERTLLIGSWVLLIELPISLIAVLDNSNVRLSFIY